MLFCTLNSKFTWCCLFGLSGTHLYSDEDTGFCSGVGDRVKAAVLASRPRGHPCSNWGGGREVSDNNNTFGCVTTQQTRDGKIYETFRRGNNFVPDPPGQFLDSQPEQSDQEKGNKIRCVLVLGMYPCAIERGNSLPQNATLFTQSSCVCVWFMVLCSFWES